MRRKFTLRALQTGRFCIMRYSIASLVAILVFAQLSRLFSSQVYKTDLSHGSPMHGSSEKCEEIHHIAFIKVHKCGSGIVENINLRFGMSRNLTFMLPIGMFMIEFALHRPWKMFLPPPPGRHFDILTHHAVYNRLELERLMPNDTVYTAILRHPFAQMRSALYYFDIIDNIPNRNLSSFLADPQRYLDKYEINIIFNRTSYELGIDPELYSTSSSIIDYINRIKDKFIIVLILERIEESLVLMKRYLCWKLGDILVMEKNVNPVAQRDRHTSTQLDRRRHRDIALADYLLYEFYLERLDEQIRHEGEGFVEEVNWYKYVNSRVVEFCKRQIVSKYLAIPNAIDIEESKWNDFFKVTASQCVFMAEDGLDIVKTAKIYQYGRANITKDDILRRALR